MADILKRVRALEAKAGVGHDRLSVILRTLVSPGASGPQAGSLRALRSPDGWRIDREPGEGREAFIQRACGAVPRVAGGVACLREVL